MDKEIQENQETQARSKGACAAVLGRRPR